jgi:DNA-binding NtrC family response regulator
MLLHADRTEIVAAELMDILGRTGCLEAGVAISRRPDGSESAVASFGDIQSSRSNLIERRFSLGGPERPSTEFVLNLKKNDIESLATVGAVESLLTSLHAFNQARIERDERSTLWPVEELPIDGERAVISGHMRDLMNLARRVATTNVNVLITGESGTGKEILARAVHNFSARAQKPFVPFNCTAIPRDLLESQLFGHRRGAFTGADRDHAGLIRSAREGTLFLDEIGELGLDLQPKLLRFLESGEISPLGEQGPLTVNVRIIAATNANLEDAVRDGRFREDLFYRLNVVRLSIRPLRERRDEIPGLVNHFVARAAEEFNKGRLTIAEETMERLLLYRWPGNVRQLQNELRRMIALAEPDSTLPPEAISEAILGAMPIFRSTPINGKEIAVPLHDKLLPTLARIECEMIKAAFREHHGKVDAVAKALGISRKGLYLKRQRLGL